MLRGGWCLPCHYPHTNVSWAPPHRIRLSSLPHTPTLIPTPVHEVHAVGAQDAVASLVQGGLGAEVADDAAEPVPEPRDGQALGQPPDERQRVDVAAHVVHEGA